MFQYPMEEARKRKNRKRDTFHLFKLRPTISIISLGILPNNFTTDNVPNHLSIMSIDTYDALCEDTDSASDCGSIVIVKMKECFPTSRSFLRQLSSDVVIGNILPYIIHKKNLATVATVSRHFRDLLFSQEAEHLWNNGQSTFHLCIDTYCATCLMKKLQRKGSHFGSIGFLQKFPIGKLKLHCFVTDIPDCIQALSSRKYLKALDLTLTNKTNSPPLEDLLEISTFLSTKSTSLNNGVDESCSKSNSSLFPALKDLTLDSSHLQHVNLPGRARLLDILGTNLESLSFSGLSPAGVFSILSSRCPSLRKLRVDRASSLQDMQQFKSDSLQELELHRSNFLLQARCLDSFPALRSLRYTPSFRCDSAQMEGIIAASPAVLRNLSLEIPSLTADDVLNAISRRLFLIESLSIQGSYECGLLSQEALLKISRKCLFLKSLEVTSTKSVSDITLLPAAFMTLASFPSLKILRLKYDDSLLNSLPDLLRQSDSLRTISFWERKKWIAGRNWELMKLKIDKICSEFPHHKITIDSNI